ncbi:MAG TPA: hypothetical protein VK915_07740 [Gaiellaceae bacterium]|nr:hypothetical protein [Gaiellaceae bacterium]
MSRRFLVVTTAPVADGGLRDLVREHAGEEDVEIRVVATASDLSVLDWLATDEDEAREEAAGRARDVAAEVSPEADVVEAEVGDADPVQAIEDALRTFPADELLLVTRREDDAGWLEEGTAGEALARFSLPVTHLVVGQD